MQNVLIPCVVKMDSDNYDENFEISDFEDELDFVLHIGELNKINDIGNNSGTDSDNSDITIVQKKRRIVIIESDPEDEEVAQNEVDNDTWINITASDIALQNIIFSTGQKVTGPQIFNIEEPIQFFELYFTDKLVGEIVMETKNYANNKLRAKTQQIFYMAHGEIQLKKNSGPFSELSLIWARYLCQISRTIENLRIPFFLTVLSIKRFNQLFWMLHLKLIDPTRIQRVSNFLE